MAISEEQLNIRKTVVYELRRFFEFHFEGCGAGLSLHDVEVLMDMYIDGLSGNEGQHNG